jgi:hypothetical protein
MVVGHQKEDDDDDFLDILIIKNHTNHTYYDTTDLPHASFPPFPTGMHIVETESLRPAWRGNNKNSSWTSYVELYGDNSVSK